MVEEEDDFRKIDSNVTMSGQEVELALCWRELRRGRDNVSSWTNLIATR